jgi:hypothetical protein
MLHIKIYSIQKFQRNSHYYGKMTIIESNAGILVALHSFITRTLRIRARGLALIVTFAHDQCRDFCTRSMPTKAIRNLQSITERELSSKEPKNNSQRHQQTKLNTRRQQQKALS